MMKKILILTVTAGNGHNACARTMKSKLESLGDVEVKLVDLLKTYSSALNVWVSDRGYALTVEKLLPIYDAFYDKYKSFDPSRRYSVPSQSTVLSVTEGLMREILDFRPDVVYCTHFYCSMALTDLKLAYDLPCKTIASALDYVNSPFWESGIGVDYFAIPGDDFTEEFMREGYRSEQLMPIGIPVDDRTLDVTQKIDARRELGLGEDMFTVTVIFGGGLWGGGVKILKELIAALHGRRAQIIMINGKNEKGYRKTQKLRTGGLKVLNVGFTDNVPLYLSASDVAISKCGGTGATEIINKCVPMIVSEKIAAQEKYNLVYLKEKGVALSFKNGRQLRERILFLADDPAALEDMSEKMRAMRKPAADDLAKFMLSLPDADYSELAGAVAIENVKKTVKSALKRADKTEKKNRRKNR